MTDAPTPARYMNVDEFYFIGDKSLIFMYLF
jgi:hypothetical protein